MALRTSMLHWIKLLYVLLNVIILLDWQRAVYRRSTDFRGTFLSIRTVILLNIFAINIALSPVLVLHLTMGWALLIIHCQCCKCNNLKVSI